jgi:hypothetical protein
MTEKNLIAFLKANDQDHEWYPTTDEIIQAFWQNVIQFYKKQNYQDSYHHSYSKGATGYFHSVRDDANILAIDLMDVGAGDGRIFTPPNVKGLGITINKRAGIEKSEIHADQLIRNGIWLIGRDYLKTTLIGKKFGVVFSNPPYSIFKPWCIKLVNELSADVLYLVIPERWKDDECLVSCINSRFDVSVVGSYDFLEGDRAARANVELLCLTPKEDCKHDPFVKWVADNIGEFESREKFDPKSEESTEIALRGDVRKSLVESYNARMLALIGLYKQLAAIDFQLLTTLGITKNSILEKLKSDIEAVKYEYWGKAFTHIDAVKTRLTFSTARSLVEKMTEFRELDFNEENIRTIIVWVLENVNRYSEQQLLKCYDDMSYFGSVRAYKSNDRWLDDDWRYEKIKMPVKGMLDYRIVTKGNSIGYDNFEKRPATLDYRWSHREKTDNIINDLCVIANDLGFSNSCAFQSVIFGKSNDVYDSNGKVLINFRVYQNGNIHIKIRQDLLKAINIEVGKLKGWLKSPKDVETEFEVSREEAEKLFHSTCLYMPEKDGLKLLT